MRSIEEYKQRVREIDSEVVEVQVSADPDAELVDIALDYRGVSDLLGPLNLGRQNTRRGAIAAVLRADEPGVEINVGLRT